MKTLSLFLILIFAAAVAPTQLIAQKTDPSWLNVSATKKGTIEVYYFNNYPFSYKDEKGKPAGIEVEIMEEFVKWLKENKGVELALKYVEHPSFARFYDAVKKVDNGVIGLGSVSITQERRKEVSFSSAYLKNQHLFITRVEVPTIRNYRESKSILDGMTGLVISSSIYEKEMMDFKREYLPEMRIEFVDNQRMLMDEMEKEVKYFGMVDIITYWSFVQEKGGVLKVHRALSTGQDYLGFVMPKNSDWHRPFNEFLEGGFGFIATRRYQEILTKYLGYEIMQSVELNR